MHKNGHGHLSRMISLAIATAAGVPLGAHAQIEEVIVTAQRRESAVQETPISIQAFTAEELELGGLEEGRDLGIMVPNVVLNPAGGGGPGSGSYYIRGLPGVGVYIDGVWQGNAGFLESDFVELERIEVLRGPQGTLFGRNTNGGAINITTRRPGDEFGARFDLTVGEFNRRDARGSICLSRTRSRPNGPQPVITTTAFSRARPSTGLSAARTTRSSAATYSGSRPTGSRRVSR
jgi:iron complex outermembrane recepter protein